MKKIALSLIASLLIIPFATSQGIETNVYKSQKSIFKAPLTKPSYWPTRKWKIRTPKSLGMNESLLKEMEKYTLNRQKPEKDRKGIRTDGIVIIHKGYLVFEKYGGGFNKDKIHITWSDAKSYVNALYGIAVKEKRIKIENQAWKYYPSLNRGQHKAITVDMLLRMSSGLYTNETYEASPLKSTVNAMLFTSGHRDMAAYCARQKLEYKPDTRFEYSSPTPNLLMAMLKNTMSKKDYNNYPWKKLFNVLGMKNIVFEQDAAGTFIGSSYIYSTPRDMARFGFLYLHDGIWENKRILPKGWVTYSTAITQAFYTTKDFTADESKNHSYGALWRLNRDIPEIGKKRVFPDVPEDCFMARGHWGQFIYVIPSKNLVVVYTGDNRDKSLDENKFLKYIVDSIK
jgi:CubicO group peptidase (beta-lactamase class C family)